MFIREVNLNTHSKPITLDIGPASAFTEIEPTAKYWVTPHVDMFFKASNDNTQLAVDKVDVFVPANTTIMLQPTGCKYFMAIGSATGFVQLVRHG